MIVEVPEPATVNCCAVAVGHSRVNAKKGAVTGSLKSIEISVVLETAVAPSAGVVVTTLGAASARVNVTLVFEAGWSGGSPASVSLTLAAMTVTVQVPPPSGCSGSSVIVIVLVPDPEAVYPGWVNSPHRMSNDLFGADSTPSPAH